MRNKKRTVFWLVCLLNLSITIAFGQRFSSEFWHDGTINLLNGDTLKGRVKYNMETESVLFSSAGKTVQSFSPRKLISFEIFDELLGIRRSFYILPYEVNGNYATPILFEVPFQGENISLLRTEKIETIVRNSPYIYGGSYSTTDIVYTYYFLKPDGNIELFYGKRNDLLRILSDKSAQVRKYIREKNLHMDRLSDLIKISAYYNSL